MIHLFLIIIKIIGIILLFILGIVVLSILLILFAPIHYQADVRFEGDLKKTCARMEVSWLMRLIHGTLLYEGGDVKWHVRIFVKKLPKRKSKQRPRVLKSDRVKTKTQQSRQSECSKENVGERFKEDQAKVTVENVKQLDGKVHKERKTHKKKVNLLKKLKITYQNTRQRVKSLLHKKEVLKDFIQKENHQKAFCRMKEEMIGLWKKIRPRTIRGNVRYGFEDPYNTGRVLAFLGTLYPFYAENIEIYPEFEEKILNGKIFVKGYIQTVSFVVILWNLFFDKNIRSTYRDVKTFEF